MHQSNITLTKKAVKVSAELLMITNGKTSSLEVKNLLRHVGYYAEQSETSKILSEVALTEGWTVHSNGKFNEYFEGDPGPSSTDKSFDQKIVEVLSTYLGEPVSSFSGISELNINPIDQMHLSLILDMTFGTNMMKKKWDSFNTVQDLIDLLETMNPSKSSLIPIFQPRDKIKMSLDSSTKIIPAVPTKKTRNRQNSIDPLSKFKETDTTDFIKTITNPMDWIVSHNQGKMKMSFPANETSDRVRSAYASLLGIKMQDARARRSRNLK